MNLARVATLGVLLLAGCGTAGSPSSTDDLSVAVDLSMAPDLASAPPDLAVRVDQAVPGMTGCHGIVACIADCKGVMGCPKTCQGNGTAKAQALYRSLLGCFDIACPTGKGDGGVGGDMNTGGGDMRMGKDAGAIPDGGVPFPCEMQNSPACKDCRTRAGAPGGECAMEQMACDADLP